jgi:hypothetical protein
MEERDINLADSLDILKRRRKLIIIVTACCFLFGVFLALFAPRVFRSQCVFVPQTNQSFAASRYSSIASMIGMDLDISGTDGPINPKVYPYILMNNGYLKELMYTPIHFEKSSSPITLYEYYTNPDYRKFNLVSAIGKYTIGLPFLLLRKMMPKQKYATDVETFNSTLDSTVITLTKAEDDIARILVKQVTVDVDVKQGVLTLTALMPEPLASAEVCQTAFDLLKKYVSDFKQAKARLNLEFIEKQHDEAKADYQKKHRSLAYYQDTHKGIMTASSQVERIRLENEVELSKQLYAELAKNLLSSRVKLEENNVTFTELSPVSVPMRKFKPRGTLLTLIWTFLGFAGSCCYVWIKESRRRRETTEESSVSEG